MEDFFEVPGYPRYLIKRDGTLYDTKLKRFKTWYVQKPVEKLGGRTRNLKRGYLIARIKTEDGKKIHIFQHRVLAMLFVECPGRFEDYIVNHKDGDGGNNDISNLEWVTYSENMLHAYQTGLCQNVKAVEARNSETGEVIEFISIADCAKELSIPHPTLLHRLNKNPGCIYEEGFAFRFKDSPVPWKDKKIKTVKPRKTYAVNLLSKKFYLANNILDLSVMVGVKQGNIDAIIRKANFLPYEGFVFGWADELHLMPTYTDWQLKLYAMPRKRSDELGWLVTDKTTGDKRIALISELCRDLDIKKSRLNNYLTRGYSPCGNYTFEKISPYPM